MTDHTGSKMAPQKDAPAGLETDGKGNVIPFERRTKDDQEKAMGAIPGKLHDGSAGHDDVLTPVNVTPK